MPNPDIARLLDEVADLLEIQNANPFRVRAYRAAAKTVRDSPAPLSELVHDGTQRLTELPGIGDDLAEKIRTIVRTGALSLHRQLKRKVPPGVLDLLRVPGLGRITSSASCCTTWRATRRHCSSICGERPTLSRVTGSLRRRQETVGDLVLLVTDGSRARIMSRFVAYPEVATIVSRGPTRATVQLAGGVQWISRGAPGSKRRISRTPCCSSGCAQH